MQRNNQNIVTKRIKEYKFNHQPNISAAVRSETNSVDPQTFGEKKGITYAWPNSEKFKTALKDEN